MTDQTKLDEHPNTFGNFDEYTTFEEIRDNIRHHGVRFYESEEKIDDIVKEWSDLFTPRAAEKWMSAGCWDAQTAYHLWSKGYEIPDVYFTSDELDALCHDIHAVNLPPLEWKKGS